MQPCGLHTWTVFLSYSYSLKAGHTQACEHEGISCALINLLFRLFLLSCSSNVLIRSSRMKIFSACFAIISRCSSIIAIKLLISSITASQPACVVPYCFLRGFTAITVKSFKIKMELAKIFGFEIIDL